MFGRSSEGSWCLRSKIDPRWNTDGRGTIVVSAGMHSDAKTFIERRKEELKMEPPDDLFYSCMKD